MNARLPGAVEDAQVLLSYAAQTGTNVDPTTIRTVVDTAASVRAANVTSLQEWEFWLALSSLAKATAPVTLSSLRATMDSFAPSGKSGARTVVTLYTGVALATLFLLLMFQVYWLFGNSVVTDLQKQRKDIADIQAKIIVVQAAVAQAGATKPSPQAATELAALKSELENLRLKRDSSNELLRSWSQFWEQNSAVTTACEGAEYAEDQGKQTVCKSAVRYQAVVVVLDVLQRYALPLLYGLLGSCVYVLRTLSTEIRARTYSEASTIGFRIRLYLGMLSGLTVAWFITPENADGPLKTISPLALAFVAGYSIELVFSAIDRILAAFSVAAPSPPPLSPPPSTGTIPGAAPRPSTPPAPQGSANVGSPSGTSSGSTGVAPPTAQPAQVTSAPAAAPTLGGGASATGAGGTSPTPTGGGQGPKPP